MPDLLPGGRTVSVLVGLADVQCAQRGSPRRLREHGRVGGGITASRVGVSIAGGSCSRFGSDFFGDGGSGRDSGVQCRV